MWHKSKKDNDIVQETIDVKSNDESLCEDDERNTNLNYRSSCLKDLNEYADKLDNYENIIQHINARVISHDLEEYTIIKTLDENKEIKLYLAKNKAGEQVIIKSYLTLLENENAKAFINLPDGISILPIIDSFTNGGYFEVLPYIKIPQLRPNRISSLDWKRYILPSILKAVSFLKLNGFSCFTLDAKNMYFNPKTKQFLIGDMFDSHFNGTLYKEFDNDLLRLMPDNRKIYMSFGLSLLDSILKGEINRYSSSVLFEKILSKDIFSKVKNRELANLIYYLIDVKTYSNYDQIIESFISSTLDDILDNDINIKKDLEFAIRLNAVECQNKAELLSYIKENFKLFSEYVANGRFETSFVDINDSILRCFRLIKLRAKSSDDAALRFMQILDESNFITFTHMSFDSIESFAKALADGHLEYLKACGNGTLFDALLKQYQIKPSDNLLTLIKITTYFESDIDLISKYLIIKYANTTDSRAIIDGKKIDSAEDLASILELSDNKLEMANRIISSNAYFPYLISMLDETSMALARRTEDREERLSYFIESLSKSRVMIKKILKYDFSYYLALNYKRYTYGSRSCKEIENKLRAYSKKKVITKDDITELHELCRLFVNNFQDRIFFDYVDEKIQAKRISDYPIIEYDGNLVSASFLENVSYKITPDIKQMVYQSSASNARSLVEKTHQSLEEGYSLYHSHFKALDKYLKIKRMEKLSKTFGFLAWVVAILMVIICIMGLITLRVDKAALYLNKLGFNKNIVLYESLLGSTLIIYLFFLLPFRKRLKKAQDYKEAVLKLSNSYDLGENIDDYFNVNSLDLVKMYNKNRLMTKRIAFEGSIGISIDVFKDMIKSPIRRVKGQAIIRAFEGLYTIACALTLTIVICLTLGMAIGAHFKVSFSERRVYLGSIILPVVMILLSYIRPRSANISRVYFWLTLLMTLVLTIAFLLI